MAHQPIDQQVVFVEQVIAPEVLLLETGTGADPSVLPVDELVHW